MTILLRTRKQEKGVPTKQGSVDVLKVVHPRGYVEVFREPITASHIIERYPRYCIARPDFFEFPWIVVHPESILFPGKVFYLVPHRTIHNLLKSKQQQIVQNQLDNNNNNNNNHYQKYDKRISSLPIKSLAGITQKHNQHREKNNHEYSYCNNDSRSQGQDSDSGSLYKPSFYKLWNKMQRNLNYETSYDQLYDDSPPYSGRPHVTSGELVEFRRLISCLKSAESDRNNLNLKVAFASPVITTFWL